MSRPPEAPIFGKISRFSQNPEVPIFRKICHFRKFLNRHISVKIPGFVRNFRKMWDFWHNYMMYWSNSGYKCRTGAPTFSTGVPFYVIIYFVFLFLVAVLPPGLLPAGPQVLECLYCNIPGSGFPDKENLRLLEAWDLQS